MKQIFQKYFLTKTANIFNSVQWQCLKYPLPLETTSLRKHSKVEANIFTYF